MEIKTKNLISGKVIRTQSSGQLKEIIIKEDILNIENPSVSLCFRGMDSSGIIDLSKKELDMIFKELDEKKKLLKGVKLLKFKK